MTISEFELQVAHYLYWFILIQITMGSYHHPSTVPPTSSHRTVRAEVDPEYLEKNPWYRGPPEGSPVIGLGGPFPRVIRRRRRDSAETRLPSRSPECPEHCLECGGNLKSLSSSPSIVATHLSYLAAPSRVTPRHYREYRNKYARFRAVFAKPLGEFLAVSPHDDFESQSNHGFRVHCTPNQ